MALRRRGAELGLPLSLTALSVATALLLTQPSELLRYQREAVLGGEVWRLVSAHFTHLGWYHLLLNLAGLALIWLLVGRYLVGTRGWLAALGGALGTALGLHLLRTEIVWYVGQSGMLHGVLTAGAIAALRHERPGPVLILLSLTAKLAWEQWAGPVPGSTIAGPVVVDAHLFGTLGGLAVGAVLFAASSKGDHHRGTDTERVA